MSHQKGALPAPVASENASTANTPSWQPLWSYLLLTLLTTASLLPYSGKAFHIDDPLFVWAAKQITQHPLDPYGFHINWFRSSTWMWQETKNPPLASYYIALAAHVGGWSERSLHLAFLLPAIAVILGTYRLARRFTRFPFLAALITLISAGFLVSSTSVMCDTLMLAFWVWAVVFWIEGSEDGNRRWLLLAMLLVVLSELTKYFGAALVPLLAAYSYQKAGRWARWAWLLLIPLAALGGFELWSKLHYGHGLVSGASTFTRSYRRHEQPSWIAKTLEGLSFTGGCVLPGLFLAPILWSRSRILFGLMLSALGGFALSREWVSLGFSLVPRNFSQHWILTGVQLTLFIAGGLSVLALGLGKIRDDNAPQEWLLALWLGGTFAFAAWLNWITNARSVLPLIPAAAILLTQKMECSGITSSRAFRPMLVAGLGFAALVAFWVANADLELANSSRRAAAIIAERTAGENAKVWFGGHSGFQYYMELAGARPVDLEHPNLAAGDFVAIPENSVRLFDIRRRLVASKEQIVLPFQQSFTTASGELGAGFYSDWGPLPFSVGNVPPERYYLLRLKSASNLDGVQ